MKSIQNNFLDQLAIICDAETRYVESLAGWIASAEYASLDKVLEILLREAEGHVSVIGYVFVSFQEPPRRLRCDTVAGLLGDHARIIRLFSYRVSNRDAAVLSLIERIKNYKAAVYSRLYQWPELPSNERVAPYLFELLDEERRELPTLHNRLWNGASRRDDSSEIGEREPLVRSSRDAVSYSS